jgi:hypothetical protein
MHPSHDQLRKLWKVLMHEISRIDGKSEIWWEEFLKERNEFFTSVRYLDGSVFRTFKSVSHQECSFYELSELTRKSLEYLKDTGIIDIASIESKYRRLTKKELIDG